MKSKTTNRFWELPELIGQHFFELLVGILAMVIVARYQNITAFGYFSYLLALFHLGCFVSEAGISDHFRNRYLDSQDKNELAEAAGALRITSTLAFLCFLTVTWAQIRSSFVEIPTEIYIIIAVTIPFANSNRLKAAYLHANGKHSLVAKALVKKQLVFLGLVFFGATLHIVFLIIALLVAEIFAAWLYRKHVKLPGFFRILPASQAVTYVRASSIHLFSGETLRLIFHSDIFILGFFLHGENIGIYSEASLLGRFFILVPVAIRPFIHRRFKEYVAGGVADKFAKNIFTIQSYSYFLHALLALFVSIYFEDALLHILGESDFTVQSYRLFLIMLPGFLLYATAIIGEMAFESASQAPFLGKLSYYVTGLNVLLNLYLVPFAGTTGSAISTVISLLCYSCIVISVKSTPFSRSPLFDYLAGAATLYLIYKIFVWLHLSIFYFIFIIPVLLYFIFYLLSIFDFYGPGKGPPKTEAIKSLPKGEF